MLMPESKPLLKRLTVPALLCAMLAALYFIRHDLNPAWMTGVSPLVLLGAVAASAGILVLRWASYILLDLLFRKRKGREAPQLLRMVISIIGYAAIFVWVYSGVFSKSLGGILATSAVLTVILGLALQDTLGNFFAGISLHIEQPYNIGDALQVGEFLGKVESVTWRTTAVRTTYNSQVILPNSRVARDPIEVFSLDTLNRRSLFFPAPYEASPPAVVQLAVQIAASVPRVSAARPPSARISAFADSSMTYELLYWITDRLWADEIEAIMRWRIWYTFGSLGIKLDFSAYEVILERRKAAKPGPGGELAKFLAGINILKPLETHELESVAASVTRHVYAPGETVLRTGDTGDSMFVIYRGQAEVLATDPGGIARRLAILEPGNVIGEMGLFTGEPRRADVCAVGELELLEIGKPVMGKLLADNQLLTEAFSRIIAERQVELAQLSESAAAGETTAFHKTILQRIKRFFSLDGISCPWRLCD